MNLRLPVRQPVARGARRVRARRNIRLASPARLAGLGLMVLAGGAVAATTLAEEFRLDPAGLEIRGLRFTDEQLVRDRLRFEPQERPNLFSFRTTGIAAAVGELPTVASVTVGVTLPDRLVVDVVEREPLLAWQTAIATLLADGSGQLIAEVGTPPPDLPTIGDRRAASAELAPGDRLDEVDLAAVLRLASVTPALIGSRSASLQLTVDDSNGWVVTSAEPTWRAVFGMYTANLRRPEDNIDAQVQCLRSLLAQGEEQVEVAYLAVADDRCGTVRDRPTPSGRIFQNVGRQATPARDPRA